eukprot:scaffold2381_cov128-Cylindrotheca_fusiformis.AAC.8
MFARRIYKIIVGKSFSSSELDNGSEAELLFGVPLRDAAFEGSPCAAGGSLSLASNQAGVSDIVRRFENETRCCWLKMYRNNGDGNSTKQCQCVSVACSGRVCHE